MDKRSEPVVLTLIKDGSIKVTGNFTLNSEENETLVAGKDIFICRCGKSSRKPFCDGSHRSSYD